MATPKRPEPTARQRFSVRPQRPPQAWGVARGKRCEVHERDSAALNSTRRLQARPDRAAVAGEAVNFNYLSMCGLAL